MPAVQLARLRIQTTRLAESFDNPGEFARGLESLLELYGNRAYRPGHNVIHRSRLPAYNVPPLVMQQLEIELGKVGSADPANCLQNIDRLWEAETLEMREIAIFLLGEVPKEYLAEVTARLQRWCDPSLDPILLTALFNIGGTNIRKSDPDGWLDFSASWFSSDDPQEIALGLHALEPFLAEKGLDYLPRVFTILEPVLADPPGAVIPALHETMIQINAISPVETRSYLRKFLDADPSPAFLRLVRRLLPDLPAESQSALRPYLRMSAPARESGSASAA